MTNTQKPAERSTGKSSQSFTAEERAAMRERAKEQKSAGGESDVLAKIAEMPEPDRAMAERLHTLIKAAVPEISARTWYGMPAYAINGNIICFFQPASKFKARYGMLGFSDRAHLDEGTMWPTYFALTTLTADDEARIEALVKQAVS